MRGSIPTNPTSNPSMKYIVPHDSATITIQIRFSFRSPVFAFPVTAGGSGDGWCDGCGGRGERASTGVRWGQRGAENRPGSGVDAAGVGVTTGVYRYSWRDCSTVEVTGPGFPALTARL
ncbi:hypothetical protein DIRU0_D10396 [Diutina rugosa]